MGILDGIVEWIAEQVMNGLDLISVSVLGALGCGSCHRACPPELGVAAF